VSPVFRLGRRTLGAFAVLVNFFFATLSLFSGPVVLLGEEDLDRDEAYGLYRRQLASVRSIQERRKLVSKWVKRQGVSLRKRLPSSAPGESDFVHNLSTGEAGKGAGQLNNGGGSFRGGWRLPELLRPPR
jgi:hypothetical protein